MKLLTSRRHSALNDTTINLLLKGDIDMGTTTFETAEVITDSDEEVVDLTSVEKEVGFFKLREIRQELEAHSSHT